MFETLLQLDVTSLLIIAVFFLFLEYRPQWWSGNDCDKGVRLMPGPKPLPIVGTSWTFYFSGYGFGRIHEYFDDLYRKYGPIVKEECWWNVPVIHLFDKRDIVRVLRSSPKYPLRPPTEAVARYRQSRPDRYASVGLVNEQGPEWHRLRTALTPIFNSPKTISAFLTEVQEIADDWCNLLKVSRDETGRVPNLTAICDRLGLEITCTLVLGRRMGFLLPGGETEIGKKLAEAVRHHFIGLRDTYFGLPIWKVFPTPAYRKLMRSEEAIYDLACELIDSADEAARESVVFQSVLKADVDEREKIAAIVDFITAGIHTMKNSLLFLLNLVGQDLQSQKNIIADETRAYSKACLAESFRLLPTASSLARILDEEMELGGYRLSAGTPVVCHFGLSCRDERNFKQAKTFRPERWLNEEKAETTNSSLFLMVPFGTGRRICPGKRFIEQILPVILEHTVRSFEIVADQQLQIHFEFLLAPKGEVPMLFRDRV